MSNSKRIKYLMSLRKILKENNIHSIELKQNHLKQFYFLCKYKGAEIHIRVVKFNNHPSFAFLYKGRDSIHILDVTRAYRKQESIRVIKKIKEIHAEETNSAYSLRDL